MKCSCPKGFPKEQTHYYQFLEGRRGARHFTGRVPLKVRYLGHTGRCPSTDQVLSVRRVKRVGA